MNYKNALKHIKVKVTRDFAQATIPGLYFHTLGHTKKVVSRARRIGKHYKLEHKQSFILLAAAWFHDIGYLFGESEGHKNLAAEIAANYLFAQGFDADLTAAVKNTITSATPDTKHHDELAQILYDADMYHVGTKGFFKQTKLIKKELEWLIEEKISKNEWRMKTIELLRFHEFGTTYCQEKLEAGRQKNLQRIKAKLLVLTDDNRDKKLVLGGKKMRKLKQHILKEV